MEALEEELATFKLRLESTYPGVGITVHVKGRNFEIRQRSGLIQLFKTDGKWGPTVDAHRILNNATYAVRVSRDIRKGRITNVTIWYTAQCDPNRLKWVLHAIT